MASTITDIPTKISVERKLYGGYRFAIDIGTLNAWFFDLTDSEFEGFFDQMMRVCNTIPTKFLEIPQMPTKDAQTSAPQPPPTGTIEHPDYYGWHPVAECIEISQHFNGNLAQAIQYIWRCGRKPDASAVKDLEKAVRFLKFEIDRIKRFEGKE